MKKFLIIIVALSLCFSFILGQALANGGPSIFVNGERLQAEAFIKDGSTYIPLRAVSEALGAEVKWNETAYAAEISTGGSLSSLIEKVSPSVVAIVGNIAYQASGLKAEGMAWGSGVVIHSGGEILTNAHVVDQMKDIIVILNDGSAYSGRVKYIDQQTDLAVVKIDKLGLPIITISNEPVETGDRVVAIGTPVSFSLRNTATSGIVSGLGRSVGSGFYAYRYIQTDAAINSGNSGGALINMKGQLVGINSAGVDSANNLGFSIPVDTINYALSHFEKYGSIKRPNAGCDFVEGFAAIYSLPSKEGLSISKVTGGAAAAAGLLTGDMIMSVGKEQVHSITDWNECMKKYLPGSSADLSIKRNGQIIMIKITFN